MAGAGAAQGMLSSCVWTLPFTKYTFATLLLAWGCAAPLPRPDQPGAGDAYRAALSGDAKGPRVREARERLEALEWDEARAAHTVFGYRRFLKEFGDSRHASEARQLLEGRRWTAAEKGGAEAALAGYLDDEPRGAHADEAWARLSSLRLGAALRSDSAASLRTWLLENPSARDREKAQAALDDLDWRAAGEATAWRRYLDEHLDGAHGAEAQAKLGRAQRDEAELLEDEARLRSLNDPAADRIAYQRAAALLDEGRLAQLARRSGPQKTDASRDLAALRADPGRAALLESAAHKLYLPRATLDELPEATVERAGRLRGWAQALDGARLHRLLGELASPRASVALAALDGAETLLQGLPAAEARVRAERELVKLRPLAIDAPQLAALAVLQLALGRFLGHSPGHSPGHSEGGQEAGQEAGQKAGQESALESALESARSAAARNPRCAPAVWLAARLVPEQPLQQIALQGLRAQARDLGAAHAEAARAGDAAALAESCAALRAADRAAETIAEAKPEAVAIRRQVEEGARKVEEGARQAEEGARHSYESSRTTLAADPCAPRTPSDASALAVERLEAARALIAAGTPLARPALARAAARDPDARVRAAVEGAVALDSR